MNLELDLDESTSSGDDPPLHIFVIQQDVTARDRIVDHPQQRETCAIPAPGWQAVANTFEAAEPNLVILNLRLDKTNGLDILREIRTRYAVPVIVMADDHGGERDRVATLELGADDYITEPLGLRELLARIRATLKRCAGGSGISRQRQKRDSFQFGGWRLERHRRRLINPNGAPVALTKGEYALLNAFLDAPQRPLTREYLLQAMHMHGDVFDRSTDVLVLRLRRKLEIGSNAPQMIQTKRGIGYLFALPVELV